jgi:phage terminase large subunit-like protein
MRLRTLGPHPLRRLAAILARHIGNAVLREDTRGARLAKEGKDSPRRIDAAVAAVMAHDRAAALAGTVRHSIYI